MRSHQVEADTRETLVSVYTSFNLPAARRLRLLAEFAVLDL